MPTLEKVLRTDSAEVRQPLVDVLTRDLVGALPEEVLSVAPSRAKRRASLPPAGAPNWAIRA